MQSIVLSVSSENVLSKHQQQFNKLIKDIERTRKAITNRISKLDKLLADYLKKVLPQEESLNLKRFELLKQLDTIALTNKLNKKEKELCGDIITFLLSEIFSENLPTDEQEKLYDKWSAKSYKQETDEQVKDIKKTLQDILKKQADIDMDIDDFENNSEGFANFKSDFEQKMKETMEYSERLKKEKNAKKKKTLKQIEKDKQQELAEELKGKNLRGIYVSLAKLLHPDTETDEVIKTEKEEVMKKVTAAYEAKDLSTLLTLEIEWVHKNNNHLHQLKDDVLKMYCQILKEQLSNLHQEKYAIENNPKYSSIFIENSWGFGYSEMNIQSVLSDIKAEQNYIDKKMNIAKDCYNNEKDAKNLLFALEDYYLMQDESQMLVNQLIQRMVVRKN